MTTLFRNLINIRSASLLKRCMHATTIRPSYEGEGKTTVTILNHNYDYGLMVDNVSQYGFLLNSGVRVIGPMVIFPKTTLSWNIASSSDMNEASFSLLLNLEPKLDILVVGLDDEYPYDAPFLLNLKDMFKKYDIIAEILPVHRACSTFNFLNSENRYAAAALIPPKILYTQDVLLPKPKDKKMIQNEDRKPHYAVKKNKDPIIPILDEEDVNERTLRMQKELEASLKPRSPWKPEDRVRGTAPTTTEKPIENEFVWKNVKRPGVDIQKNQAGKDLEVQSPFKTVDRSGKTKIKKQVGQDSEVRTSSTTKEIPGKNDEKNKKS